MEQKVTVYALRDPEASEVRYIGKTSAPKSRMAAHYLGGRPRKESAQ